MSQFRQLRIIHPLAVDRSVVYTYSFRMKNAPERMFRDTVAFANVVNGTGSWVLTDDLEVYERIQRGFSSGAVDWAYIGRGHGRHDCLDQHGQRRGRVSPGDGLFRLHELCRHVLRLSGRLHVYVTLGDDGQRERSVCGAQDGGRHD